MVSMEQQAIFHWAKGICRMFWMHNLMLRLYDIVPYKTRFMSTVGHTKSRQSSGSFVTGGQKIPCFEVELRLKAKVV